MGTRNAKQVRWHANELRKKASKNPESVPDDLLEYLIPTRDIWSLEEITRLKQAIKLYGADETWCRIAKYVQSKTVSQIRNCFKRNYQRTNSKSEEIDTSLLGDALSLEFKRHRSDAPTETIFQVYCDKKRRAKRNRALSNLTEAELAAISEIKRDARRTLKLDRKEKVKLHKAIQREREQCFDVNMNAKCAPEYTKLSKVEDFHYNLPAIQPSPQIELLPVQDAQNPIWNAELRMNLAKSLLRFPHRSRH